MGPDDDVLPGFARKIADDVPDGFDNAPHVGFHSDMDVAREREGAGLKVFVDIAIDVAEIPAALLQQFFAGFGLHHYERDAGVGGPGVAGEFFQVAGTGTQDVGENDGPFGAMEFGVSGFGIELGVASVDAAREWALVVCLLRFAAEEDDDLVFDVDAGVIVIVVLGSGDAVAHEDHFPVNFAGGAEIERDEFLVKFQGLLLAVELQGQSVRSAEAGLCRHREALKVAPADGLEPSRLELFGDHFRRRFELFGTGAAPAHFLRRQHFHIVQIMIGVDLQRRRHFRGRRFRRPHRDAGKSAGD